MARAACGHQRADRCGFARENGIGTVIDAIRLGHVELPVQMVRRYRQVVDRICGHPKLPTGAAPLIGAINPNACGAILHARRLPTNG